MIIRDIYLVMEENISEKKITLEGEYSSFDAVFIKNKSLIFENLLDLFTTLRDPNKTEIKLSLTTMINDEQWDSELKFRRTQTDILMGDIKNHYEDVDDYETCIEIVKLHKEIGEINDPYNNLL